MTANVNQVDSIAALSREGYRDIALYSVPRGDVARVGHLQPSIADCIQQIIGGDWVEDDGWGLIAAPVVGGAAGHRN